MFVNIVDYRVLNVNLKTTPRGLKEERNETPQYPTRRAQEPRLTTSAWLAPLTKFVVRNGKGNQPHRRYKRNILIIATGGENFRIATHRSPGGEAESATRTVGFLKSE